MGCVLQFDCLTQWLWISQSGRSWVWQGACLALWIAVLLHMEMLQHFSGQGEADLAALLSPRLFFPQVDTILVRLLRAWGHIVSKSNRTHPEKKITLLNHTGHVLILPLALKLQQSHILCKYIVYKLFYVMASCAWPHNHFLSFSFENFRRTWHIFA